MAKAGSGHAFHVDRHGDHWDVFDQEGRVIGHRHDQGQAIELAIAEAQHAEGNVVVCVQQPNGHYTLAWSSR